MKIEGLELYQSKLEKASGGWLKAFRQKSFSQWAGTGIPTIKDEEWKYTSLADSGQSPFQIASHHQLIEDKQFADYRDKKDINIVLVNGVLWNDLSDLKHLPQGLRVSSLNAALDA